MKNFESMKVLTCKYDIFLVYLLESSQLGKSRKSKHYSEQKYELKFYALKAEDLCEENHQQVKVREEKEDVHLGATFGTINPFGAHLPGF